MENTKVLKGIAVVGALMVTAIVVKKVEPKVHEMVNEFRNKRTPKVIDAEVLNIVYEEAEAC